MTEAERAAMAARLTEELQAQRPDLRIEVFAEDEDSPVFLLDIVRFYMRAWRGDERVGRVWHEETLLYVQRVGLDEATTCFLRAFKRHLSLVEASGSRHGFGVSIDPATGGTVVEAPGPRGKDGR